MIAPNTRSQIRKRLAQQHAKSMAQVQRNAQRTLNAILWQLITENAQLAEDEDGTPDDTPHGPPMLTIPCADLKKVPANFSLAMKQNPDDDTISVIAVLVKPKSNIILPGDG